MLVTSLKASNHTMVKSTAKEESLVRFSATRLGRTFGSLLQYPAVPTFVEPACPGVLFLSAGAMICSSKMHNLGRLALHP